MHSVIVLCLAMLASTTPTSPLSSLLLWNGVSTVNATVGPTIDLVAREAALMDPRSILSVRSDCKGSAFCERLHSCDNAYRKIDPGATYGTSPPATNSGVCDATCGIFFEGVDCKGSGNDLMDAYLEIRRIGCKQCGRTQRGTDRCLIKIDRVTGCH